MPKLNKARTRDRNWSCRVYDGLYAYYYGQRGFKRTAAYRLFAEDCTHHKFNGLITLGVEETHWSQLLKPLVTAQVVRYGVASASTDLSPDYRNFTWASIEYLAGLGLKQVVYLRPEPEPRDIGDLKGWAAAARRFKMQSSEVLHTEMCGASHSLERNTYELAVRHIRAWRETGRWPEAIVIADDVAMRALALALIRYRVNVPERLRVLTWANEDIAIHYGIPVIRHIFSQYIFSPAEVAQRLMAIAEEAGIYQDEDQEAVECVV